MAETSYPLPPNRVVTDAEYEKLTWALAPSGVVGRIGDTSVVYGDNSGMQVKIRANKLALVRGFAWESGTTEFTKTIDSNSSGSTRFDLIVLRLTRSTFAVTVEVVKGTAGAGDPSLTQDVGTTGVYEVPLASVRVIDGASAISAANVEAYEWYVSGGHTIQSYAEHQPFGNDRMLGQLAINQDTGRAHIWNGTGWGVLYEDSGKVNLTAASGWSVHSNGAFVRRRNGWVMMNASFTRTGGAISSGSSLMCTLPTAYRPQDTLIIMAYLEGAIPAHCRLATNGQLTLISFGGTTSTGEYVVTSAHSWPAADMD